MEALSPYQQEIFDRHFLDCIHPLTAQLEQHLQDHINRFEAADQAEEFFVICSEAFKIAAESVFGGLGLGVVDWLGEGYRANLGGCIDYAYEQTVEDFGECPMEGSLIHYADLDHGAPNPWPN
ncbi:MAG: hypothetical protein HY541_00350 [Deltaproteobacteria bacterium]|nr:hypothetical protein [Deltaproteobacteria bacterium]